MSIAPEDIKNILQDILDTDLEEFTAETSAKDVDGWDSLNNVRLLLQIEREYGVDIPVDEIENLKNVGDLITVINKLVAEKA
ncbi:acyl carrier protein [Pseudomethylobacillus aquaticus]|uniref:Acyl carrier protein n=1 Tax=Pseudomethylobacillus aquaticus TaxID=2676064 RepID=A0A3N0V3C4_9PROT|nr:acyl carrier protein [Pseudomethylobacillus aquaticus]ROH87092.1 acyl carrier protein [Pseudomethylobacillus aquaticus]